MYRHKKNKNKETKEDILKQVQNDKKVKSEEKVEKKKEEEIVLEKDKKDSLKDNSIKISSTKEDSLHELLEKNLKWSQIIYEQNRKINNKLLWSAIAGWLRVFLILIPLVLAMFYLPPLLKDVFSEYGSLLGILDPSIDINSTEGVFDDLPLGSSGLEKFKSLIGK